MSIDNDTILAEVHAQHADLASWLGGPDTSEAMERFITQLHPDFSMVTLDGAVVMREQLAEGLRQSGNSTPGLTIDILDLEVLHRSVDGVVVRFTEVQHSAGGTGRRLTTALLAPDPRARNGLRWRAVHETATTR